MKALPFVLRGLTTLSLIVMLTFTVQATTFSNDNWNISYHPCDGYIEVNILYFDTEGINDWMNSLDLYYVNADGSESQFFKWRHEDITCSDCNHSHTWDDETFNYVSPLLYNDILFSTLSGDLRNIRIQFYNLPDDLIGTNLTIRMDGYWHGGGSDDDVTISNWDKTADLWDINPPTALMSDLDMDCDYARITWTNPADNICESGNWEVIVYRDGTEIGSGGKNGYYNDMSAVKGQTYDYTARTRFKPNNLITDESALVDPPIEGRRLGPLAPPTNLTASRDRCSDQKILLEWVYGSTPTPDSFIIERKTVAGLNYVRIDSLEGTLSQYLDSPPMNGTEYLYRIRTKNVCDDIGTPSSPTAIPGVVPGTPAAPTNVTTTAGNASIIVNWQDNSNSETGFIIVRTNTGGLPATTEVSQDVETFTDYTVANCVTYTYTVKAKGACNANGVGTASSSLLIQQSLQNTFPEGSFSASKGYDPDKVVLEWNNNNGNLISIVRIYRRVLGSGDNYALLFTLNTNSGIYNDVFANAGVLYEYMIFGESPCENTTFYSDTTYSIGFRRKAGTITGQVTYAGGTAVKDVKISAESTSGIAGRSLSFIGGSNQLSIPDDTELHVDSTFLFEAWIRPSSYAGSFKLAEKSGSYLFEYNQTNDQYEVTFYKNSFTQVKEVFAKSNLPLNNYSHLAIQIYHRHIQIFVNGNKIKDKVMTPTFPGEIDIIDSNAPLNIGKFFTGLMDEIRVWSKSKSAEEILRDYSRIMIGNEDGLEVYLPVNEGVGQYAYDASKSGTIYNKNHAAFNGTINWSSVIPTISQLSAAAYTSATGNYTLVIPYNGAGEVFELTPSYTVHEFDPSVTALFVGDGAPIHNNINFKDKSSFRVTGAVNFKNTTCGVPNAFLKVDGEILVVEGIPAKTDATGAFDIQVPIGMHHLEVEQGGHVYSVGRFPATGKYDFQEDLAGINFTDETLVKVVGRVVGGLREGSKTPGLGLSKNNIGVAHIVLTSQQGNGCSTKTIDTDPLTGEYEVMLPPLKYVPTVNIPSNPTINFGVLDLVDLSGAPVLQTAYDTIFDVDGDIVSTSSVQFHKQLDYIYRVNPIIAVFDRDGESPFIGDTTYTFEDANGMMQTRNLRTDPFRWPLFTEKDGGAYLYRCMIRVFEPYVNFQTSAVDSVPTTDGILRVENEFADVTHAELKLKDYNTLDTLKSIVYSFKVGKPNFQENLSIPEYSFTQKLEINLIPSSGNAIPWLPVTNIPFGGDAIYRAYFLGTQTAGDEFVTFGPEVPEYVLRDPPGSDSQAKREVSSTKTEKSSWDWTLGAEVHTKDKIFLGAKFNLGLGLSTATEIINNNTAGFSATIGGGNSGYQSITTTNTKEWTTSNDFQIAPGAASDVYIGTSRNLQYGIAEELAIIPQDLCSNVQCIGGSGTQPDPSFTFGKRFGLSVVPGGYETQFQFTEYAIKNTILPDLINLRNVILQSNPKYISHLSLDNENYGKNNDDPVFGDDVSTDTPDEGNFEDLTGPSYTYAATSLQDSVTGDSVRVINIQIDKWIDAITLNEWEKVHIDDQDAIDSLREVELDALDEKYEDSEIAYDVLLAANIGGGIVVAYGLIATPGPGSAFSGYATFAVTTATSIALAELQEEHDTYLAKKELINDKFDQLGTAINYTLSGGTTLSSTMTQQSAVSYTQSIEYATSASLLLEVEGKVNNNGVGIEKGIEMKHTSGRDWGTDNDSTQVVGFTLEDKDVGDLFSVDVFPSMLGWGPIFKNKAGGATSCPHEDEIVTEYYEPGTVISERTLQIEKPTLSSSQSILTNIPSDQAAVFNLTLGNESENGFTNSYELTIEAASNPFGAIVRFDGLPNQSVIIPAGAAINKVMTISKGAGPVFDYDSILILFSSSCQYKGGAGFNKDIADSVYVSAHFLPNCTEVALASPEDKWVLNNSFHDTMPVAIVDYNINFDGLQNIRYEYKPSSSSNWIGLQTFLKDTSGVGGEPIPTSTPFTLYDWDVAQLTDGLYDVRVSSTCPNNVQNFSPTYSGVIDRINPHAFGNPSPADGIASPNDEISMRFNEPIDLGSINQVFNFDIRGVTNGTETDHSTSLFFNGTNNYLSVDGGLPVQNRDFTLEFSAKRARIGEECLFSQGTDANERLFIGFNAANKFVIRINGVEVASNAAFTDQLWHYFAVSYDYEGEIVQLFVADEAHTAYVSNNGNTTLSPDFTALSVLEIGRNSVNHSNYFQGNIHEVRVWNTSRTLNEFSAYKSILISGAENGILYNWRMDEATGNIAEEHIRRRDADIVGATWQISPNGNAAQFDGFNDVVKIESGDVPITPGMDFTLEFWFNATSAFSGTMFSNGNGNGLSPDSLFAWEIRKGADNFIHVLHHGIDFTATDQNYFDGTWHHFALVLQRGASLSIYIDGELQNSTQAEPFGQLASSHMYLGATGYLLFNMETIQNYYTGKLDEFRFWNTARKISQIKRDKQHRMNGDEIGLKVYLPFEHYSTDPSGIPILTPTFNDQVINPHMVQAINGVSLINQTPTIKLQRPVQQIAFTYSVNNDQVILTPTTSPEIIENVTLDVSVQGIKDLHGNVMESPVTWIAYMDKNQVVWQDDLLQFSMIRGDHLTFSSTIINQGGAVKAFHIENIPSWLTVTPSSGTVNPNSSIPIEFKVDDNINFGDYTQDIKLLTDFNFPERLTLQLKVRSKSPEWAFDPSNFEHNMSIVGRLKINGVISTDDEDMIIAMVGEDIRGIGQLEYVPELDVHLVFLNIFSQAASTETLSFRIWDASKGLIYTEVLPNNLQFSSNMIVGTPASPVTFESGSTVSFEVPIKTGWTWLGFPLAVPVVTDINNILVSLTHTANDVIKSQNEYCNYNGQSSQFVGTLDDPGKGIKPEMMLKLYNQLDDILIMKGTVVNPTTKTISLVNGWNWIGFISIRNQSLDQALGNLTPHAGDIVKSKTSFAIYDAAAGWIGSLTTMTPGSGYMYKSNGTNSFTYPLAGMFNTINGPDPGSEITTRTLTWKVDDSKYYGNMTVVGAVHSACDELITADNVSVGIRDKDGHWRAISAIDPNDDAPALYLTIAGNEMETLDVYVLDENYDRAIYTGQQIEFAPNEHLGDLYKPVQFNIPDEACDELNSNETIDLTTFITVYPTPFRESFKILYRAVESDAHGQITVSDVEGRILYKQEIDVLKGQNEYHVNLASSQISAGMYVVELRTQHDKAVSKIVKSN